MKKFYLMMLLAISMLLVGCGEEKPVVCEAHVDANADDFCDNCEQSLLVYVDFYGINDLHGKFKDGEKHPGVDELTTYLKNMKEQDDYAFFLSAGDMWQGSAESNMTKGQLMTEWLNELDCIGMAVGNHEFDWGEEYLENNSKLAEFPFLAINIYDRETNELADYCQPSVVVEAGELKIGIIGAIGDCYSSIAAEKAQGVYFKVKKELTALVKAEADRLRTEEGVDCIVYTIHDGLGQSNVKGEVPAYKLQSYYDVALSDGYVDVVFEGHTHQGYVFQDEYGVYHLQNRGDNSGGISHIELAINSINNNIKVNLANLVSTDKYQSLQDDPIVENLLEKYKDDIAPAYEVLGKNNAYRKSEMLRQLVSELYFDAGNDKWDEEYEIALGGGFISIRSPYNLPAGDVKYEQLQSLFPFDNELVLCSILGSDLQSYFIMSDNENYFITCRNGLVGNIDPNKTYYIVIDTYTSTYRNAPKSLKEIVRYDAGVYARDLLAEYIKKGGLE